MTNECPQCKSPIARQGQRFCYHCGHNLYAGQSAQDEMKEAASETAAATPADIASDEPLNDSGAQAAGEIGKDSSSLGTQVIGSPEITLDMMKPLAEVERKATLRVLLPTGDVFDREIARAEIHLGKGPRNDVVVADPAVSTSHAIIRVEADAHTISDLGSRNGTYINGELITEPRRLNHGDIIGMGLSRLTFRLSDYSDTSTVNLSDITNAPDRAIPPPLTEDSLAAAVITEGLVAQGEVERLRKEDRRLYRALVEAHQVEQERLRDLMSRTFKIPVIDLRAAQVDEAIAAAFPARLARARQIFPVAKQAGKLTTAVADPTDTAAVEQASQEMSMTVETRLATANEIAELVDKYYGPKLIGVLPSGEKLEYLINQNEIEIGKAAHNHIVLTDPTVSNTHAILLAREGGYNIVDLGSRNGTFVNGERLGAHARTLRHGDSIQLGQTVLTFRNPGETSENITATLSAEALAEVHKRAGIAESAESQPTPQTAPPSAVLPSAEASQQAADVAALPVAASTLADVAPPEAKPEEEKDDKKKKKKKRGKDDRLKAAYISGLSRIVAQVLGVVLAVALALYVNSSMRSGSESGKPVVDLTSKGRAKLKLSGSGAGTAFRGGAFEASGAVYVPNTDGVLMVDDSRQDEVLWMRLDEAGNQDGDIKSIPLGVKIADPEGITYDNLFFYVVGSQSHPKDDEKNGLVRFRFDAASGAIQGQPEAIKNLRGFLLENVAELRGEGERSGVEGGLNIEGIAWDPVHARFLLGLRSPVLNGQALIVPIKMRDPLGPFSISNLQLAEPRAIQLPLGGLGIRDIAYDSRLKSFLIISGATETMAKSDFKLWEWSGDADQSSEASKPREEASLEHQMKPEGITRARINGRDTIFVCGDAGSFITLNYAESQ